eukprot:scaffold29961_cov65-Phaeocystis_antarctica.AAC.3
MLAAREAGECTLSSGRVALLLAPLRDPRSRSSAPAADWPTGARGHATSAAAVARAGANTKFRLHRPRDPPHTSGHERRAAVGRTQRAHCRTAPPFRGCRLGRAAGADSTSYIVEQPPLATP